METWWYYTVIDYWWYIIYGYTMIFSDITVYAFICIDNLHWYISSMNNLPLHGNQRLFRSTVGLRLVLGPCRIAPSRNVLCGSCRWLGFSCFGGEGFHGFTMGVPRPLGDYSFNGLSGKDCYFLLGIYNQNILGDYAFNFLQCLTWWKRLHVSCMAVFLLF